MLRKSHKYLSHLSIFLLLGSYVVSPVQAKAQEFLVQESIYEQVLEESQQIENETYTKGEEADVSDVTTEMSNNENEIVMFPEKFPEESANASEIKDDETTFNEEVFSTDGYSHVETSPGVVVATTPSDATLANLATYLEEHFQRTDIQSLTVHGMVNSGTNTGLLTGDLSRFTSITYIEFIDLEIIGEGSLKYNSRLLELYIPKVKTIEVEGLLANVSLIKLYAPLLEVVESIALGALLKLEVLIAPNWQAVFTDSGLFQANLSLIELSAAGFESTFPTDAFPNVEKQTINSNNAQLLLSENHIVFSGVEKLIVSGPRRMDSNALFGYPQNVKSISSETISIASFTGYTNLEEIDFDERLETVFTTSFSGTKIGNLRLSSARDVRVDAFGGAEHLKEIYLPVITDANAARLVNLPDNVELVGTTSTKLSGFQNALDANPNVLFAATESNEALALGDKKISIGGTDTLKTDVSTYILNEDLIQTAFDLTQSWFFEGELIGTSDTYTITNMNQNNVGSYNYSINIIPTGEAMYSGSRESRKAQIDIVNEISFTSDFSVNSVVGGLKNLEILFASNVTNMNTSFQIVVPESLKVDAANIELYLDNASSSLPLGATVKIEDRVVTITNFPLISGFNYHINIPIMPIAVSEQTEEIKIDFLGNFDPLRISGDVIIASGEFNVSIPDQINFEETSLDFSSIQSVIQKVNPLDIEITSFTAQEESWEIMVSATPFMNTENQEIGEEAIRLVYKEDGDIHGLSEEISLATGSFSGKLDYDFQTDAWSNTSFVLTELEEEGFHVLVGNDYYKLESQQYYTTEVNFTIEYSP